MADGRRANELKSILRLAFLYGCFHREDISNILNIHRETLNREYSILTNIFDKKYCIPDKRKEETLLEYDRIWQRVNELSRVYGEEEPKPLTYKNLIQYIGIMRQIQNGNESTAVIKGWKNSIDETIDFEDIEEKAVKISQTMIKPEIRRQLENAWEDSSEKPTRKILHELTDMGVIKLEKRKYMSVYPPIKSLQAKKYDQLSLFIQYAVNLIFPALPGYNLLKMLERKVYYEWQREKQRVLPKDIFVFPNYQPQTILDEENFLELEEYQRKGEPVKFLFRDNRENVLEVQSPAETQEKNVLPYCFLHEIRYGRTYLVGYCTENERMMGYEIDRIRGIAPSQKKKSDYNIDLEKMYQETFSGSWIGGRTDIRNQEMKCVRLEINAISQSKIEKEGITNSRKGRIFEENGNIYYEIVVPNTKDMKPWIMSLGSAVKVVSVMGITTGKDYSNEANELKQDVKNTWEEMRRLY